MRREGWQEAWADAGGALVLVRQDLDGVTAMRRTITAGHSPVWAAIGARVTIDSAWDYWTSALLGSDPVLFRITDETGALSVQRFAGETTPIALALPEEECRASLLFARGGTDAFGPFAQLSFTCHNYANYLGTWRPGAGADAWKITPLPLRIFASMPLGAAVFSPGTQIAAFIDVPSRPFTGEAGLAWQDGQGGWHFHTSFVPGGTDQMSRVVATVDAGGWPVLLVAVGMTGSNYLTRPELLYLVRYHP